jgi:hypothetical protein
LTLTRLAAITGGAAKTQIPISFKVEGLGQLIGENQVKLRAGKMIILAHSAFLPGEMTITATAHGLRPASVKLQTQPVPPGLGQPKDLPAKQASPRPVAARVTR